MKIVCAVLLLAAAPLAHATDLRGRVEVRHPYTKQLYPRSGVAIQLAPANMPQKPVRRVLSGPDGMYYLTGIAPGNYVLVVNNTRVPLAVRPAAVQDIQAIQVPS